VILTVHNAVQDSRWGRWQRERRPMCAEFKCMWDCFTGFKGEQTSGWGYCLNWRHIHTIQLRSCVLCMGFASHVSPKHCTSCRRGLQRTQAGCHLAEGWAVRRGMSVALPATMHSRGGDGGQNCDPSMHTRRQNQEQQQGRTSSGCSRPQSCQRLAGRAQAVPLEQAHGASDH
jgi:hypothetical protein